MLITLAGMILGGCGIDIDTEHAAALRRWEAQPPPHYLLRTREEIGGQWCGQTVEVRNETVVAIRSNSCRHPTLWTASQLFRAIPAARSTDTRCSRFIDPIGCVCRDASEVQVEYDSVLGYPRTIIVRQTWRTFWEGGAFWRHLVERGHSPDCTPPFVDLGRQVIVRELRPLP
jgi:hypothetical protein